MLNGELGRIQFVGGTVESESQRINEPLAQVKEVKRQRNVGDERFLSKNDAVTLNSLRKRQVGFAERFDHSRVGKVTKNDALQRKDGISRSELHAKGFPTLGKSNGKLPLVEIEDKVSLGEREVVKPKGFTFAERKSSRIGI